MVCSNKIYILHRLRGVIDSELPCSSKLGEPQAMPPTVAVYSVCQKVSLLCLAVTLTLHCVLKNVPPLTCYSLYIHGSIATIFDTTVAKKVSIKMYIIYPPHLASASALPGETGNPEIASFHLNATCFFHQKTGNTVLKYHLVRAEPPFIVKTIDWVHQTGPRKGA